MRHQDVVDASQLGVDLEAQVGEGLRGRFHYVLHLHALGGHAEEGVTHPLHLSCRQKQRCSIHTHVIIFLCSILISEKILPFF